MFLPYHCYWVGGPPKPKLSTLYPQPWNDCLESKVGRANMGQRTRENAKPADSSASLFWAVLAKKPTDTGLNDLTLKLNHPKP